MKVGSGEIDIEMTPDGRVMRVTVNGEAVVLTKAEWSFLIINGIKTFTDPDAMRATRLTEAPRRV